VTDLDARSAPNPAMLAAVAGAPVGVVVLLVLVLVQPVVAVVLALAAWAAASAYVWLRAGRIVLGRIGGRAPDLTDPGAARLDNLLGSVAAASGVPKPALLLVDDPAPDALVTGAAPRSVTFVATTGLLERLDRLQLEAVVAHQLAVVRSGATHPRDVATVVLGIPGTRVPALAARAERAISASTAATLAGDSAAVGVTRYPPGLLGALEVAAAAPPVGGDRAIAPLWWVPPARTDLDLRLDHLRELT
jgi:Zn-dependent protease with chaperone function